MLGATIFVAVLTLIEPHEITFTWKYSKHDFAAMMVTLCTVLLVGVEAGVIAGVTATISLILWRTSRPHTAIVGPVEGGEQFRNIDRHLVKQVNQVLVLRIDESLFFGNLRYLDNRINGLLASHPAKPAHKSRTPKISSGLLAVARDSGSGVMQRLLLPAFKNLRATAAAARTRISHNSKPTSGHLKVKILNRPLDTSKLEF